jgi:hypothetical protein
MSEACPWAAADSRESSVTGPHPASSRSALVAATTAPTGPRAGFGFAVALAEALVVLAALAALVVPLAFWFLAAAVRGASVCSAGAARVSAAAGVVGTGWSATSARGTVRTREIGAATVSWSVSCGPSTIAAERTAVPSEVARSADQPVAGRATASPLSSSAEVARPRSREPRCRPILITGS